MVEVDRFDDLYYRQGDWVHLSQAVQEATRLPSPLHLEDINRKRVFGALNTRLRESWDEIHTNRLADMELQKHKRLVRYALRTTILVDTFLTGIETERGDIFVQHYPSTDTPPDDLPQASLV
jgi:hypothetical protein